MRRPSRFLTMAVVAALALVGLSAGSAAAAVQLAFPGTAAGGLTGTTVTLQQYLTAEEDAIVVFVGTSVGNRASAPSATVRLGTRTFTRIVDRTSTGSTVGGDRDIEAHVLLAPPAGTVDITVSVPTPPGTTQTTFVAATQAVRGDPGLRLGTPDSFATRTGSPTATLTIPGSVPAGGLSVAGASLRSTADATVLTPATELVERAQGTNLRLITAFARPGATGVTVSHQPDQGAIALVPFRSSPTTEPLDALPGLLAADRTLASEVVPTLAGRLFDWAVRPRAGSPATSFSAFVPWGVLDDAKGRNPQPTARVELGAIDTWLYRPSLGRWTLASSTGGVHAGGYYDDDFRTNGSRPAVRTPTPAGTMTVADIPLDSNFHFFGPYTSMNGPDVTGVVVVMRARLAPVSVPWNPLPRYALAAAVDWYKPDVSHQDGGVGRFKGVDGSWRAYTMSALGTTTTLPPLDIAASTLR